MKWATFFGALVTLLAFGCGDHSSVTQLTCFNNGPGAQQCIDGAGNVTDSPCVTVNGALTTNTGQPCDASTTTTENPPEPTAVP